MIRCFIAISLKANPVIQERHNRLLKTLSKSRINWVPSENYHIGMKFLGEIEEFYLHSIFLLLNNVSKTCSPFNITLDQIGCFGPFKQPRVIWQGIKPCPELYGLQIRIEETLEELGFPKESKKYIPHITLGRVKQLSEGDAFQKVLNRVYIEENHHTMLVNQFILFKSELRPNGPIYSPIQTFILNG